MNTLNKSQLFSTDISHELSTTICIAAAVFSFVMTSCSSSITVQAKKDCSSDVQIQTDLGNTVLQTIKSVTAGMNQISSSANGSTAAPADTSATDKPVFSAPEISQALSQGDITNVVVQTPTSSSISVSGTLPAPADQKMTLKQDGIKLANFITCTKNSLTLILAPETVLNVVKSLPEESQSYLDLLMAPVITGEQMSASEYVELVGAVYGDEMSKELASSAVKISLVTPAGVQLKKSSLSDTKNVKTAADRVVFSIPLAEFLTLSTAQTFSISW